MGNFSTFFFVSPILESRGILIPAHAATDLQNCKNSSPTRIYSSAVLLQNRPKKCRPFRASQNIRQISATSTSSPNCRKTFHYYLPSRLRPPRNAPHNSPPPSHSPSNPLAVEGMIFNTKGERLLFLLIEGGEGRKKKGPKKRGDDEESKKKAPRENVENAEIGRQNPPPLFFEQHIPYFYFRMYTETINIRVWL